MLKLFLFSLLMIISSYNYAADIQVIAQPAVPDVNLTKTELIHIFTRKKMFWSNGQKIRVFIKPTDSIEHKFFTINVLNLSPYRYKATLESVIYSGENTSVIEVASDEEMLAKITVTPYSIGYLNYNSIVVHSNADVVTINYE